MLRQFNFLNQAILKVFFFNIFCKIFYCTFNLQRKSNQKLQLTKKKNIFHALNSIAKSKNVPDRL